MAWAEQLASGRWRGCYRDQDGKKRYATNDGQLYEGKRAAKEAAEDAAAAARRTAATSAGTQSAKMPWRHLWEMYHEKMRKKDRVSGTLAKVEERVEHHIMPKWGDTPLNKISHGAAQDWVDDDLCPGRAPGYVCLIWYTFASSMTFAVKKRILDASPCVGIDLPKIPNTQRKYLTDDPLAAMKARLHRRYQWMLEFQYETGLRPEELIAMHVSQVDGGWLTVSNVYVEAHRMIRPFTKTGGIRHVPLTHRARELYSLAIGDRDLSSGCGIPHVGEKPCRSALAFLSPRLRFVLPSTYRKELWKASTGAGLPSMSPYTARRGFATAAADRGVSPFLIQAIMGHKNLSQTSDYVQRSEASRLQFLAAMGDRVPMTVVGRDGERGADRGANSLRNASDGSGSDKTETGS
ncbi:tyrosine-type recombinase/integrase [Amycolatopsis kentuckyensis]|uniref:tyrosine-type recombinase/integrase n=1 Tax=Amycolatopsis kentuckyensis TaxID=218823 RepID=UPI000A3CF184|nr:tyrosine-type recombinase/integrase [Amycolatopsis kentuckyensis]